MGIEYRKGSLFESAGKGVVLTHAVNAQGRWSAGIASEFYRRYKEGFKQYNSACMSSKGGYNERSPLVGTAFIVEDTDKIGCLVTSNSYGGQVDGPSLIIAQTKTAVRELLTLTDLEIHSNKFNSGLFRVDWEKTEAVIEEELKALGKDRKWVVWDF